MLARVFTILKTYYIWYFVYKYETKGIETRTLHTWGKHLISKLFSSYFLKEL